MKIPGPYNRWIEKRREGDYQAAQAALIERIRENFPNVTEEQIRNIKKDFEREANADVNTRKQLNSSNIHWYLHLLFAIVIAAETCYAFADGGATLIAIASVASVIYAGFFIYDNVNLGTRPSRNRKKLNDIADIIFTEFEEWHGDMSNRPFRYSDLLNELENRGISEQEAIRAIHYYQRHQERREHRQQQRQRHAHAHPDHPHRMFNDPTRRRRRRHRSTANPPMQRPHHTRPTSATR